MVSKKNNNDNVIKQVSFNDTEVIGINSRLADYKLAWSINDALRIGLKRQDDFVSEGAYYPFFHYQLQENTTIYNLLGVNSGDRVLGAFKPRVDYLFIIRNEQFKERIDDIFQTINEMEDVCYAFPMDNYRKKIELILYDIEQYEVDMIGKQRWINSPEYACECIRRRDMLMGVEYE